MGKIASDFSRLKSFVLDAFFARDRIFQERPHLKLITRVREINVLFSRKLYANGHTREFENVSSHNREVEEHAEEGVGEEAKHDTLYVCKPSFDIDYLEHDDFENVIAEPSICKMQS